MPRRLRGWVAAVVMMGGTGAASCTLINQRDSDQCSSNSDCTARGSSFTNSICGIDGLCIAVSLPGAGGGGAWRPSQNRLLGRRKGRLLGCGRFQQNDDLAALNLHALSPLLLRRTDGAANVGLGEGGGASAHRP